MIETKTCGNCAYRDTENGTYCRTCSTGFSKWKPMSVTEKQIEEKIVFGLNGMSHEDIKSANEKQVSGTHYKGKSIQPWDYIASNNLGYFEGNCVKYVSRWKDKGGVADLHKAIHYLEKLIELTTEEGKQ